MTDSMKDALKGSGGGLQSVSGAVGDMIGNASDTRGSKSKQADQASSDLMNMGKSQGESVESKSVKGSDQIANQGSGSADHLELGMRKQT